MTIFLKKAVQHQLQTTEHTLPVKVLLLMKLVQDVLRPLDRPCHQLRIKHHVQRIDAKVPLCPLIAPVHFDGVAHGLKGVKAQPDGQQHPQVRNRVVQAPAARRCR